MVNKLFTLLLTLVFAISLSGPMLSQEGSKPEEAKGIASQDKAETKPKKMSSKMARLEGVITRSNKDDSSLTVRQGSTRAQKIVRYDGSTQWTSQEHGKTANSITANDVQNNDRVICRGHYDDKGEFHATQISKRLTQH
jgi:hypothetical protein